MSLILFIGLLCISIWLTNGLVLFPIRAFHLPSFPLWLDWAIGLALVSWFIGD